MPPYFQATQAAEAKHTALSWLASQLRWEQRLASLRGEEEQATHRAA
jgi:hypothetical protein